MSTSNSAPLHTDWRRHFGIRNYPTWKSMPPRLQFLFMAGFGLLRAMTMFQLSRIYGPLKEIVNALDRPCALQQLSLHDGLQLAIVGADIAWLLFLCWYSGVSFKACRKHLSDQMSQ